MQLLPQALSPDFEVRRLTAVRRYEMLDTPPDGAFDRVTAIAADLFSVPISIISLVDEDRIWFKSHHGLDVQQIDRGPGLCASAIMQAEPWVLTNAETDPRSLANPLVAGEFGLRFYIGVPLTTHDGFNLGTLCVIDKEPRAVTERQISHLRDLASLVMDQMELRLSARRALAQRDTLLSEVNHRVANSLALVASMAHLQSNTVSDPEARAALEEMQTRITAIANVHRQLYTSGDVRAVAFGAYLKNLAGELEAVMRAEGSQHTIQLDLEPLDIATDKAVSLGVIVSELITNAYKYAYPQGVLGDIRIRVRRESATTGILVVEDDGVGMDANAAPRGTGVGGKILKAMAGNLGSTITFDSTPNEGTRATMRFALN